MLKRTIIALALAGGIATLGAARGEAQPGCTAKYGYWNGSGVTCTNDEGNNCITCPPWP